MSDGEATEAPAYPAVEVATIYSDGVLNFLPGREVSRFYLARNDPAANAPNASVTRVVAQVVMPTTTFVETALFFELSLKRLVRTGVVTEELVSTLRATAGETE